MNTTPTSVPEALNRNPIETRSFRSAAWGL